MPKAKKVVFLGPKDATFSHRAWIKASCALKIGVSDEIVNIDVRRNSDILATLLEQEGSYGIIAAETEVRGRINESLEAFGKLIPDFNNGDCPIEIIGGVRMPLSFALMTRDLTPKRNITKVFGHAQAIAACENNLKRRGWTIQEVTSNGIAVETVANGRGTDEYGWAALGPVEAAERYGLIVKSSAFEDAPAVTTFFVLGPSANILEPETKSFRALIVFRLKDGPLALVNAILPFGQVGLDLTYVHSFHSGKRMYEFIAEIECPREKLDDLDIALKMFNKVTLRSIVFGPFPVVNV